MKFEKKIVALLLVFVLLLSGCTNGQLSATDDTTAGTTAGTTVNVSGTDETTKNTEPEGSVTCQYLPKEVENPDSLPVLKWVCLTHRLFGGGNRMWNEEAAIELNQMLSDRNMPFRVQFVLLTTNNWLEDTMEWFTYPEAIAALADADLIYGGMNGEVMVQYLSPITDHVTGAAEPSLEKAAVHEKDWLLGTVAGEIYGYSAIPHIAYSNGWRIDPALLVAAGLKAEDLQRDFWDMDDILAKLYAANKNRPFFFLDQTGISRARSMFGGSLQSLHIDSIDGQFPKSYQNIVGFFNVDYSQKTPAIVNYLETETTRKLAEAVIRYTAAGYATEDPNMVRMWYTNTYGEAIYINELLDGYVCIPTNDAYYTEAAPEGFINGVAAVSQHKAEAISLLNLIAEDEAFRMQLFYGKEGRDYTVEDGYYDIVIQEDGSNYSLDFLSPLAYFCGLTEKSGGSRYTSATENWYLYIYEEKTAQETYQEILDECACYYPIVFDYTGIEQELAAMEEIFYNKYEVLKSQSLTEEIRQKLIADLKAAGSDKVLAELQRQLTDWQKNNPDWPLKPEE